MQTAADPFKPLLNVIERYRNDVHSLRDPATSDALDAASQNLPQPIPRSLLRFLHRWNGAVLFRGVLQIRSVSELAPASEQAASIVVFADGPLESDHWAYAPTGDGDTVFGRWTGQFFEPLHGSFEAWLDATIHILDNNIRDPQARFEARLRADPSSGYLLMRQGEQARRAGHTEGAINLLRQATTNNPNLVDAWQRLGSASLNVDPGQARWALLKALRGTRLPQQVPTETQPCADLIATMSALFPPGDDAWERELIYFLAESVSDVENQNELALVEAAGVALANIHLDRLHREEAHTVLVDLIERCRGFRVRGPMPEATLCLARIEIDLGHHDDAERRLRALRNNPGLIADRAQLLIGAIAVSRQEPWCEEILLECIDRLTRPEDRCEAMLLLGERHLLRADHAAARRTFEGALELANATQNPVLASRATLGLGDIMRISGEVAQAAEAYQEARTLAENDPEQLQRVLIRRGDLYRTEGDMQKASADYARAADEYARLGLPIREAWARLRMAQAGVQGAAETAHALFKAADHAAGVAASDAISGMPARSLDWHMNRTAEHARDRWNAQRARPPLSRADADRPERRMGAHRMAVAACSTRVVEHLTAEINQLIKTIDLSSPRSTDPNLARFVAATDLLSAHRSYEAAESLLGLLLGTRAGGIAKRALIGAMARSPNAALVDGLLDALEGGRDPHGVAAAAEILGLRREPMAISQLKQLAQPGANPTTRKAAITSLGRIGDISAIEPLLPSLDDPDLAEHTSVSLLLLGEWQGVDFQAQSLAAQRAGMSRSLGEIVGRYGGPNYLLLLFRSADLEGPAGLGAMQGLGYLGDPRAVPRLLESTSSRDQARARVASGALEIITGHHEDPEESLLRNRWTQWWEEHQDHFEEGFRYRHGRLMDPGLMIARLSHDEPLVRRATYDELVIATGQRLPFDAEGPFRLQAQHIGAWRQWWMENREAYPSGRWTFHGEIIG